MARLRRGRRRVRRTRADGLPARQGDRPRAGVRRQGLGRAQHPVREHDPGRGGAAAFPATRSSSGSPLRSSAGTRSRSSCRRTPSRPSSAGTSRATSRPRRSTRSASTTSGAPAPRSTVATSSTCRGTRPRDLRPRVPRGPTERGAAAPLPAGGRRRRPLVVPASLVDAGLLAVPDRVDGPRPADGDLPGPVPQVPGSARRDRPGRPEGLGLHGRRRDGRARIDGRDLARRPREARQPRLRDQLQPAAPRRPGAR